MLDRPAPYNFAADQFRDAIAQKGLVPPDDIIGDGKRHRFSSNGKPDDDAGWYIFNNGSIATGSFGDFRTGRGMSDWVADIGRALTPGEASAFKQEQQQARIKREADTIERRAKAKAKAAGILKHSKPARNDHPYLMRKGVSSHGLRIWKDLLVVPMIDETGDVQSLQLISGNGDKKFLSGGKMQGCYFTLGSLKGAEIILIAEGYATAATIHEITGHPVVVAYNAGNLTAVAKSIRVQHPDTRLFLCADDDIKTPGNPGKTKADEAANVVNGEVIVPDFGRNRPDDATDFNDMLAHAGKDAVTRFFIRRFLEKVDDALPPEPEDSLSGQEVYFCRPEATTAQHSASPYIRAKYEPEPVAEPNTHFSTEDFEAVNEIWKAVPRRTACHSESGYHLIVDEKRKVIVTKDRIELARKPKHRLDASYVAACQHARHFWGGQMEIHGDTQHCIKAWAYAQAYGVQVMNYKPTGNELAEVEKILNGLRKDAQPAFRRPASVRPRPTPRQGAQLQSKACASQQLHLQNQQRRTSHEG